MVKQTLPIVSRKMSNSDEEGIGIGNCQASDVQSWWEVPCIAHFCSLFRLYFELLDFDIEELEEALITDGVEDSGSSLLQDLIVRLLRGCFNASQDEITSSNYQMYLRRLFRIKCEEDPSKINPFDGDVAFHSLPLRTKVEILRDLCDFRLDNEDVPEALKTLEAQSLRVEPLGQDSGGSTYWYFYGTRLYREDYSSNSTTQPARRRGKRKQDPKQFPEIVAKWQVVCFTEQDWQILTQKFKNCKSSYERNLYRTLHDDFLPELPRLFAEKEKLQRKRMLEQQLRRNGRSSSFLTDKEEFSSGGVDASTSSSVNGCGTSGSVNGIGAGCSSSGGVSGACNGVLGGIIIGSSKPSRIRSSRTLSLPVPHVINSISSILDKSSIVGLGVCAGSSSSVVSTGNSSPATSSTKARRGGYDDNSWCQDDDDDNNNKINAMDLDEEHSERECSPAEADEEELRRRREEQEKADRLLAEAIEREERKARLHLRERRGGTFSSPSNAGSRNSSSVSTERPQSIKASTVSKQTVAAAVSKKNSKASPVKASPVKVKKGSKSGKGRGEKKSGRMTNNSLSVSLSPLVDDDDEDDAENGEKKRKKKKKRKHHEEADREDEDDDYADMDGEDGDKQDEDDEDEPAPKKKSKSIKSGTSPKKVNSKKKKKYISSKLVDSRSPSPSSHSPSPKKVKKSSKTSPASSKKKTDAQEHEDAEENEEESQMDVDEEEEEDDFCEEEEEADYESIVARTLHNNNNKVKEKGGKEKVKSKEKIKSKEKKKSVVSGDDDDAHEKVVKKSGKEKIKDGGSGLSSKKNKKSEKLGKSGKMKDKDSSKKSKSSKSESSSSGLIGASTVNLGSGTSKTKVKSSVLFSQSEEDVQIGMHKVIEAIKNHRDAWPFINPVDEDYAPNYYKIIDHPMDLQTMEDKLDNQEYSSLDEFKGDFARIVDNCRKYNGPVNEYTEMVETVEQAFNKLVQRYIVPDESDEEISIEYTTATSSERKRPSSKSLKKKDKEASSKSVSGGTSSAVSKEHKKENEPTTAATLGKKSSSSKMSSSASPPKGDTKDKEKLERKKKKQQLMRHHSRDSEAIENLASVAAETLKDINKWLGDTPKPPEIYGGATSSEGAPTEPVVKPKLSSEAVDNKAKAAKIPSTTTTSSPSPVIKDKKTKKILSTTPGESSTPVVGQKRKLEFSSNKKARSTQFIMDEDDEYNIDRDLSPPPPKITKKKDEGAPGKTKGSKKNKAGGLNKEDKKEGADGKVKDKLKKDKHHHHHHKHHHHHHHHHSHKRDGSSAEKDSPSAKTSSAGTKPKTGGAGNLKKSASMSSSSSVSSMSTSSSSVQPKPKVKKNTSKTTGDDLSAPAKKPKSAKRPAGGLGSTGNLLNTLKNSAAYKRMNQISRATKALASSDSPKLKSDSLLGLGTTQVVGATVVDSSGVGGGAGSGEAGATSASAGAEKKKCLLLSDLPADKDGGPKLSLGSVLSTDAIKLVNLKEVDEELSDEDEFSKPKGDETKSEKDTGDLIKKEMEEAEEKEEEEINRKLEPSKGFNREKCMPNLSAWIKAFGGPAKGGHGGSGTAAGNGAANPTTVAPVSPLVSPVKKPDPDSKNKFRVMGRGVGETESKSHVTPLCTKPVVPSPSHHPSVIKTSSSIPSLSAAVPVVRHHPAITDSVTPTWSPLTPLPGPSPSASNPMLNPIKQAALAAAERGGGLSGTIGEDLSSPPRSHSHHSSKKHRNRKMSSSSLSSQSESGSPLCVSSGHEGISGSGSGSYVAGGGSGGVVVNPPRWVDDHPWGPVSQSQSPSASSHVSSQSPAGPNSPFSPSISSPPPSTPQTPPRPPAPVRVGFYQDITASQHSSPEKVNESQSSPATPPTPNSVHGSASSGGSGGSNSNTNNNTGSSRRGGGGGGANGNGGNRESGSGYPTSTTPLYAPRYVASTPSPNVSGGPGSNASSGLPSPSTPASNTSGGHAESPGNPNSPHSPKVVNMSSGSSSSGGGNSGATDYRSHSSSSGSGVATTSSTPTVNGPQTPAHQQSSRSGAASVLHSSSPYGTPPAHHYSSSSMMEQHLRNSPALQLPDPAHSHHHHSPSSSSHAHHHQTPAHAHSNAPQTSHPAHVHSLGHLGQPQQAHVGSSSNQYHESSSSRYPPNLPHAHQQSSTANTSSTSSSTYSGSASGGTTTSHQNLAQAHAHSRQPTSQPHLSHPYPSNPYTSNPRSINVAPNVYNNPISADPAMNRYYKAAMVAAASASGAGSELSLSMGSSGSGGSSSSTTSAGATNTSTPSSSSTKRSSRSNASANATPSPHPDIPRSASVNPTAAVAAALEGKLGPGDLANGFWPHNLASLTQIVNSIPNAYRHYTDAESLSKYQRAAAAAAAAQQESNSYPVTTNSSSGGSVGVITSGSGAKSGGIQSSGSASSGLHHHHHHHSTSSEKGSSGGSNASDASHHHHHLHHHHAESVPSVPVTGSSSKKQSKSSSESKSSRSQSNASGKSSSSSSSAGGMVPGSAFNFSSLTPDSLALYSKEMSEAATNSLYSASPPTLTPPLAHRASEFYPTASSASHFPHHSFSAAARTTAGGVPTPPITPYPFIPGSHPSPYQAHQPVSSQPFAAHSQSSRGLDPYQQLFQGSPHVMGLLSHPSGYPAPYAHPHSSLGFNRPGGWI